ncbi:hypothetical protein Btru_052912 [Bulinus truncatus]|nr:hypothetical protein Btru_052912 [Bulinus truncatus]
MIVIVVCLLIGTFIPCEAVTASSHGIGPVCGEHTCAKHGHCAFKKGERFCVCNRRYQGIGHFICVQPNEKYCVIFNDPSIKSFDGSHLTAPGEQMTFAAHIAAKPCYKNHEGYVVTSHGSCDVRVYLWYCRRAGKFFVCGTVVKVILFLNNTVHYHTTRIHAKAKKGHYSFREEGQKYEFGNGQYGDPVVTTVPGLGQIKTVYDRQENFAFVDIAVCGVKVGLRPADSVLNPLITPAGLVVITTDECENSYLSSEQTICIPPVGKGPSLNEQIEDLSKEVGEPVTKDDLTCHKVICGDVNQNL